MKESLAASIANDLRSQIKLGGLQEIPSVRTLAAQRKIAYPTAWRILDLLRKEGLIVIAPGMKARRAESGTDTQQVIKSAADTLFEKIKDRIEAGVYKSGRALPKTLFIALSENISTATVSAALRLCETTGLAHRQKRAWFAGPLQKSLPAAKAAMSYSRKSSILLQTFTLNSWQDLFDTYQLSSFMMALRNELAYFGIGIMPVVDPAIEISMKTAPKRWTDSTEVVRMLGMQYRGAVALAIHPTDEYFGEYLAGLCRFGKPVVYFDHVQDSPKIGRGKWGIDKMYYHFYFDHRAAVQIAVESLASCGHRRIGIYGTNMADWARTRTGLLRNLMHGHCPVMELVEVAERESIWIDQPGKTVVGHFMRQLDTREGIRSLSPQFVNLVHSGITALVALNDSMAWKCYFALQKLGVSVPKDISLISFDNEPAATLYPITTIDLGFSHLGYQAAHLFIGDINVAAGRMGESAAVPFLVDRGSLSVARS